jgi:hypothetical protein
VNGLRLLARAGIGLTFAALSERALAGRSAQAVHCGWATAT